MQAAEDAVLEAVKLFAEGTEFTDLPDKILDAMTPAGRKAARTLYPQQLSGEAAPKDTALEAELYDSWMSRHR